VFACLHIGAGQAPGIGSERGEHDQQVAARSRPCPNIKPGATVVVNPPPDPRQRGLHEGHDLGGIQVAPSADPCGHDIAHQDFSDEDNPRLRPLGHIANLYRARLASAAMTWPARPHHAIGGPALYIAGEEGR
jgi:hypothetical protein